MAVPRTSVEPPGTQTREPREGLSVQTLIIAAIASGIAAIIVSQFWESGTIFASAMTPVVVAIASELLRKPVESERLRSGVRNVSSVARPSSLARPRSGRTPNVMAPPPAGVDEGLRQREEGVEPGPVRVYSSGSNKRPRALSPNGAPPRRRLHLKVAIVTGLVAFLIAAAVLTLPELIFGGSVSGGGRSTTVFGGGSQTDKKGESQDGTSDGQSDEPTQQDSESAAPNDSQDQPQQGSGGDQPEQTTPETTSPSQNTTPTPTPAPAPAPSTPAP